MEVEAKHGSRVGALRSEGVPLARVKACSLNVRGGGGSIKSLDPLAVASLTIPAGRVFRTLRKGLTRGGSPVGFKACELF